MIREIVTFQQATHEADPPAAIRSAREDYGRLTDTERAAVENYEANVILLGVVPLRGQVYLRRHGASPEAQRQAADE